MGTKSLLNHQLIWVGKLSQNFDADYEFETLTMQELGIFYVILTLVEPVFDVQHR